MTLRLLSFLFLLSSIKLMAQDDSARPAQGEIFSVVDQMPDAGYDYFRFLAQNIRYPAKAQAADISGTVYLEFIVQVDGSITDVGVIKGIGYGCDEEAVRVLKLMPPWIPGKQNGKPLVTRVRVPIRFRLADSRAPGSGIPTSNSGGITPGMSNDGYYYPDRNAEAPYDVEAFFRKNMRYPERARLNKVGGMVVVHFAIDVDGKISDATLGKGIGYGCDEEAVRLVGLMPPWKPALKLGKPVIMFYRTPVVFKLPK